MLQEQDKSQGSGSAVKLSLAESAVSLLRHYYQPDAAFH
jgi:hypothetical protein